MREKKTAIMCPKTEVECGIAAIKTKINRCWKGYIKARKIDDISSQHFLY